MGDAFSYVGSEGNGLYIRQFELAFVAPVEERFYRARIRRPGVAVADGGGELVAILLGIARHGRGREQIDACKVLRESLFGPVAVSRLIANEKVLPLSGDSH